jgi:hypothetical protein
MTVVRNSESSLVRVEFWFPWNSSGRTLTGKCTHAADK